MLSLSAIALAVTLLRLTGERLGWSETWFDRASGSVVPSRLGWVIGITWLALPFGAWLAARRVAEGDRPLSTGRAVGLSLATVAGFYLLLRVVIPWLGLGFPALLFPIWGSAVLCAAIAWRAWPALARPLLAYGVLSRLPVVIVMALALHDHWGTHYDFADAPVVQQMPYWSAVFWLALVPQLVFWVAYTVIAGMAAGTVTAAVLGRRSRVVVGAAAAVLLTCWSAPEARAAEPPVTPAAGQAQPASQSRPQASAAERVRARELAFAKTMADRDHAAFASFVSDEALFLGRTVLRGRQAVAEGWKPLFQGPKAPFSWEPETVEVIDSGTLALSRGPVFGPDGKRTGTFNSTWRLEKDGEWRVVLDSGCPPCACP